MQTDYVLFEVPPTVYYVDILVKTTKGKEETLRPSMEHGGKLRALTEAVVASPLLANVTVGIHPLLVIVTGLKVCVARWR